MNKPNPAQRAIRLIFALQGHAFDGVRLKALAEGLGVHPATCLRDLETLAAEGVAERVPGREERWRLTPKLVQLARAHELELARVRQRLADLENRYSREVA